MNNDAYSSSGGDGGGEKSGGGSMVLLVLVRLLDMLFKDFSEIHRRADGHTLLKRCVDASNNYLLRRFTFHSLKL